MISYCGCNVKRNGIVTERKMTKPLEVPVVGKPCLIQIGNQVYETSEVVDWFHNLKNDTWTISTQNSVYSTEF